MELHFQTLCEAARLGRTCMLDVSKPSAICQPDWPASTAFRCMHILVFVFWFISGVFLSFIWLQNVQSTSQRNRAHNILLACYGVGTGRTSAIIFFLYLLSSMYSRMHEKVLSRCRCVCSLINWPEAAIPCFNAVPCHPPCRCLECALAQSKLLVCSSRQYEAHRPVQPRYQPTCHCAIRHALASRHFHVPKLSQRHLNAAA